MIKKSCASCRDIFGKEDGIIPIIEKGMKTILGRLMLQTKNFKIHPGNFY